ncbi:hypothetical protein BJ742DRAFT_216975 [Cladochytrium replicatum]|nr:hypothetical protein BJ742DRAFT_216975 [Cladochytrium replicatum]
MPTQFLLDFVPPPEPSDGDLASHPPLEAQNSYDDLNRRFRPAQRLPAMLDKWGAALKSLYDSHPECIPERALRNAGWSGIDRSDLTVKFTPGARLRELPQGYTAFEHVKFSTRPRSIHNEPTQTERNDLYVFGHPHRGRKFRSVPEFIPHLIWMAQTPSLDPSLCKCKYCNGNGGAGGGGRSSSTTNSPFPTPSFTPQPRKLAGRPAKSVREKPVSMKLPVCAPRAPYVTPPRRPSPEPTDDELMRMIPEDWMMSKSLKGLPMELRRALESSDEEEYEEGLLEMTGTRRPVSKVKGRESEGSSGSDQENKNDMEVSDDSDGGRPSRSSYPEVVVPMRSPPLTLELYDGEDDADQKSLVEAPPPVVATAAGKRHRDEDGELESPIASRRKWSSSPAEDHVNTAHSMVLDELFEHFEG